MQPMDDLPLVSFHIMTIMQTLGYVLWNLQARFLALDTSSGWAGPNVGRWSTRPHMVLPSTLPPSKPKVSRFPHTELPSMASGEESAPFGGEMFCPSQKGLLYQLPECSERFYKIRGKRWGGVGRHEREREKEQGFISGLSHIIGWLSALTELGQYIPPRNLKGVIKGPLTSFPSRIWAL